MNEAARAAGASRLFSTTDAERERGLGAIGKDMRRLRERRGLPAAEVERLSLQIVDGLASQLFNTPLDLFIEARVYADFPTVRDAQFAGLAKQMAENARILTDASARDLLPQRVWQANVAMNAALALFVDSLYGGRTAYAAAYGASGMLQTGRRLLALFEAADQGRPGAEYELVDGWAEELRLRDWYRWLADDDSVPPSVEGLRVGGDWEAEGVGHRTAQQTVAMREGGPTNPDYLAQPAAQAAATFYMLDALKRFSAMTSEGVYAVAAETAIIGMSGINYIAGEEKYTLKTLPGEKFSGLQLLCLQYVGFKLTRPDIDPKIPLDAAYRTAKAMFDAGG